MWYDYLIPIGIAIGITLIHFLGEKISEKMKRFHFELQSFGSGLLVGVIFLELLPHIATGQEHLDEFIYLPFLFGFVIIFLIEKFVYRNLIIKRKSSLTANINTNLNNNDKSAIIHKDSDELIITQDDSTFECISKEQNALFEGVAFLFHGLIIGLLIAVIYEAYQNIAFIVLIPFLLRAFTLSFSTEQFMEELSGKREKTIRILSLFTPTLGATMGVFLVLNKTVLYIFYALALGLVLYIVIRDMLPLGKKGKPFIFISGVILATTIFLIFELVVKI